MTTPNINLGEGIPLICKQTDLTHSSKMQDCDAVQNKEEDKKDFSFLIKEFFENFSLETRLNDQTLYSPFKYCFFNIKELNAETTVAYQKVAHTIFNNPFSYFSQDSVAF